VTFAFAHVALNCRDLDVTEAFYTRVFGFERARRIDLGDTAILFLRLGELRLELFAAEGEAVRAEGDGPHAAGGLRHLALQTEDVDAFLASLGDAAEVTLGPLAFDDFIPGWKTVWLRDPDGVIVEVSQGYADDPALASAPVLERN
jgi:glyoxylase I family protein